MCDVALLAVIVCLCFLCVKSDLMLLLLAIGCFQNNTGCGSMCRVVCVHKHTMHPDSLCYERSGPLLAAAAGSYMLGVCTTAEAIVST